MSKIRTLKKTTRKRQSVAIIMKQLRPMLPGVVKKQSGLSMAYVIDGKCLVELNYFCSAEKTSETVKTCYPFSIKVGSYSQFGHFSSYVFHSRTFKPRKDGTFSLESVAATVTKCVNAVTECIVSRKTVKERNELIKSLLKKNQEDLLKALPELPERELESWSRSIPHIKYIFDPQEDEYNRNLTMSYYATESDDSKRDGSEPSFDHHLDCRFSSAKMAEDIMKFIIGRNNCADQRSK